jgi:hypothetical protein
MSNYQLVEDSVPWSLLYDDVLHRWHFRLPLQGKKKMHFVWIMSSHPSATKLQVFMKLSISFFMKRY